MELADLVSKVLEVDPAEVTDQAGPDTLGAWTSLRHLELVVALEEVYGLSFTYREIAGVRTIGALRQLLRGKGVAV